MNLVSGLTMESAAALPGVTATFAGAGIPSWSLVTDGSDLALASRLRQLGFVPGHPRPAGILDPLPHRPVTVAAHGLRVTEARTADEEDLFLDTLVAGYRVGAELGGFLRAEHSAPGLRRFLAWQQDQPVAAAAFSVHRDVAVIGGAATLPEARGRGAQLALLGHRLSQAAETGAQAAMVTAAPGSASARNLARTGFVMRDRMSWGLPGEGGLHRVR
ncbi:MAG: GNAT family N-acetyltransferase [Actinomycetota bacterium]